MQREQAQARFARGKLLYDAKKYEPALAEFRAAIEIVASPNARLYAARCLRETGKFVEAYVEFGRTAVEAGERAREDARYARAATSARVERDALASKLGFVSVQIEHPSEGTTLRIAGDIMRRAGWGEPAPVRPGTLEIVVETPPGPPIRQGLTLDAGEKKSITIDAMLPSAQADAITPAREGHASDDHANLRPFAYAAGAVGAAGLLTFVIAGALSNSTYSDLRSRCPGGGCPAALQSEVSRGTTEQTLANVGLVVGLLGAGGGVALYVLSMPRGASSDRSRPKADARRDTAVGGARLIVGPLWVGVAGAF